MSEIRYLTDTFQWQEELVFPGSWVWGLEDGRLAVVLGETVAIHDASGARLTEPVPFPAASLASFLLDRPGFAALPNGGFALAWPEERPHPEGFDFEQTDLFLRVFDADGTPRTEVLPLGASTNGDERVVVLAPTPTGFLAVWENDEVNDTDLLLRAFDGEGAPLGDARFVNQTLSGAQLDPALVPLPGGEIVLAYRSFGLDFYGRRPEDTETPLDGLLFQVLDAEGATLLGEQVVPTVFDVPNLAAEVAALTDDRFVVSFQSQGFLPGGGVAATDLYARTYALERGEAGLTVRPDAPLVNLSDRPEIEEFWSQIVGTPDGGFFAAWVSPEGDILSNFRDEGPVLGRFFGPDGTALGAPATVMEGLGDPLALSVAPGPGDAVVVNWTQVVGDPFGNEEAAIARTVAPPGADPGLLIEGDGTLEGTPGNDTIRGGEEDDTLEGLTGRDRLEAGGGDDLLRGAAGDDTLEGGAGDDGLDGGPGADVLRGGPGDDRYLIDDPDDRVREREGEGFDRVYSFTDVRVTSEIERVTLLGTDDLRATGNFQAQRLDGNRGDNVLVGRGGADTMVGGAGDDVFVLDLAVADAPITVLDFSAGDRLAIDDRFFGLGDGVVELRDADPEEARTRLASGEVDWDRGTGEFTIDGTVVAILLEDARLRVEDVLLF